MIPIPSQSNAFGGVVPDPTQLEREPEAFREQLNASMTPWRDEYRVVWLEIPQERAGLVPVAVELGFDFHHCGDGYLMLTHCLDPEAHVPAFASHYIGAGGVVLNDSDELLVVSERYHRRKGPPRYKMPGGALHPGEHLSEAVVREVLEETGVRTRFETLICFRHWHGYRYGKSDIYFICRLSPLSEEISIQEEEIAEARWMPVAEYLAGEHISVFNKEIVRAATGSVGLERVEIEGYGEMDQYEIYMPHRAPDSARRDSTARGAP